jgi:hypothetical protein
MGGATNTRNGVWFDRDWLASSKTVKIWGNTMRGKLYGCHFSGVRCYEHE